MVAGGVGLAPLHYLATTFDKQGREYELLAGVSSRDKFPPMLATLTGEVRVFSDDGSIGTRGMVCDAARPRIDLGGFRNVYTCGPEAMMAVVAGAAEERDVPCEVSLDARMACGIGACSGCVRPGSNEKNLCVCTDGPVFDSREVLWNR
jgi:dihydroorotate dehydrogenase electron transfer subunit